MSWKDATTIVGAVGVVALCIFIILLLLCIVLLFWGAFWGVIVAGAYFAFKLLVGLFGAVF